MKKVIVGAIGILAMCMLCIRSVFAEPPQTFVTVALQAAAPMNPGGSSRYTVTVLKIGHGDMDDPLKVTGLPAGATGNFSPDVLHFRGPMPESLSSELTITTSASTPMGIYYFVVTGDDGTHNPKKVGVGMLVVGSGVVSVQMLSDMSAKITCSGAPGQTYVLEATTNLTSPTWINISTNTAGDNCLYSYIDNDAKTCPCRFYRMAIAQ